MIPDKIYTDNRGVYAELPIFSQTNANIEYISKDALLEWAKEQKEEAEFRYNQADMNFVREVAFDDLIDKLNSM